MVTRTTTKRRAPRRIAVRQGTLSKWGYKTTLSQPTRRAKLRLALQYESPLSIARALMARATLNKNRSPIAAAAMHTDALYVFRINSRSRR